MACLHWGVAAAVTTAACVLVCSTSAGPPQNRSFSILYENDTFLKDGKPFRYVSGSMHYFRVPAYYWRDRMEKMKAAGLNAVQTYVEWSQHEPFSEQYDFTGDLDLLRYLKTASETGLLVILRPGPYICAERDMGGLPFWLLQEKPSMTLRSSDPDYLKYVDRWFGYLLPLLKPYMYSSGGPIIMVQVENEYGSYDTCDQKYTTHLRDLLRSYLGNDSLLFTTDGDVVSDLKCGKVEGVYATVDFGTDDDVVVAFSAQRQFEPRGPLVNSEFYAGWLDYWGRPHAHVATVAVAAALDRMLAMHASVNIYMIHGGTSFGFTAGADGASLPATYPYNVCPTSYDYDAPITEAGDPTPKLMAIRQVIGKYLPVPSSPMPGPTPKASYGRVAMSLVGDLFRILSFLSPKPIRAMYPLTFEQVGHRHGYMLYETKISGKFTDPARLSVPGLRDRGYVFLDKEPVGILSRSENIFSMPVVVLGNHEHWLHIMVENQGRICYGTGIRDFKGIISNVTLSGHTLTEWTMWPFLFNNTRLVAKNVDHILALKQKKAAQQTISGLVDIRSFSPQQNSGGRWPESCRESTSMSLFAGTFTIPQSSGEVSHSPQDTFLRLDGWTKGIVLINDFNLGRYWPVVGPQVTLFVPKTVLRPYPQKNIVIVFEQEHAQCRSRDVTNMADIRSCYVQFVARPDINGTTPVDSRSAGTNGESS